ncbi:ATP-binding protein [Achromobacter animicus]|uniref:ATP-binding protein n=1 Tax=Achromobacter animicus TaxID=1389935 RepID=UPI002446E307|nr:ATP-binding protein [Achromobacter animicus]MDH0681290.1 ATP-binding protein [Achromobacter animicus]
MRWRKKTSRTPSDTASKPLRGYSLRRRLIGTTLGSSILVGLVSTLIVLAIARKEVNDAYDDWLEEGARLVLALGEGSIGRVAGERSPADTQPALRLDYQLVSRTGEVLLRGEDAPKRPFVDPERRGDRYYDVRADGEDWRVYVRHHDTLGFSAQVGQEMDERTDLIWDMLESLAWPLVGLWVLLGLINWFLIWRLLKPLARMTRGIEGKSPTDLSPVAEESRAYEVQSITAALNRLLGRLDHALEAERRFTADAAHELRTPLAALASRIQVLQRSHPAEQAPALAAQLQRLRADMMRTTSLVENLLQLARLDPQSADAMPRERVDVPSLLQDAADACAPTAAAQGTTIMIDARETALPGNRDALFTALRNLIHNAVSYGREGGQVRVAAERAGQYVALSVKDDGPGVAPADLERLTQRFYRVLGTNVPGNGLGLSIVARVADMHRGQLQFGPGLDGRGLGVTLLVPIDTKA